MFIVLNQENNRQIIMDDFAVHLTTTDTKKKLSVGQEIIEYLSQPDNSVDCEDLGAFIDGLVPWMQSSNFKVSTKFIATFEYF